MELVLLAAACGGSGTRYVGHGLLLHSERCCAAGVPQRPML